MRNWGRIALLIALGQVALGLGGMAYSSSGEGVLASLFILVPGALTCLALRFRWVAVLAIVANGPVAILATLWTLGFLLVLLLDGMSAIWKPGGVLDWLTAPGTWFVARALAAQVGFASTSALSIVALIKREEARSPADRGADGEGDPIARP